MHTTQWDAATKWTTSRAQEAAAAAATAAMAAAMAAAEAMLYCGPRTPSMMITQETNRRRLCIERGKYRWSGCIGRGSATVYGCCLNCARGRSTKSSRYGSAGGWGTETGELLCHKKRSLRCSAVAVGIPRTCAELQLPTPQTNESSSCARLQKFMKVIAQSRM